MCAEKRDINLQRRQAMRRKGFEWKSTGVSVHSATYCICVLLLVSFLQFYSFIYTHFHISFMYFFTHHNIKVVIPLTYKVCRGLYVEGHFVCRVLMVDIQSCRSNSYSAPGCDLVTDMPLLITVPPWVSSVEHMSLLVSVEHSSPCVSVEHSCFCWVQLPCLCWALSPCLCWEIFPLPLLSTALPLLSTALSRQCSCWAVFSFF